MYFWCFGDDLRNNNATFYNKKNNLLLCVNIFNYKNLPIEIRPIRIAI